MSRAVSLAEYYHSATKYSEESIQNLPPIGVQPSPYKHYHSERAVDLRAYLPFQGFPFGEPDGEQSAAQVGELLPRLSRLLYFTNGVTGFFKHTDGLTLFRSAPSAGGLYPTEIYVVSEGVTGLEDAVHNYSVPQHRLVPVFDGSYLEDLRAACFGHEALARSRVAIVLTGVFERSAFRYHDRAYRRILLDTGHVLGNLCLYAPQEQVGVSLITRFADAAVNQCLFLDESEEGALAVIPLLEGNRAADGGAASGRSPSAGFTEKPGESLLQACHRASSIASSIDTKEAQEEGASRPEPRSRADESDSGITLAERCADFSAELAGTIAQRRSTRLFTGGPLARPVVESILDFAQRPYREGWLQAPELLETHVVVLKVEGLEAGVYRYDGTDHVLVPVVSGQFRSQIHHICLQQELGRDASAVVIHTASLTEAVEHYGNRSYRALHMDAGLVGECLNLAAVHLGVGVTGIGGFFDDEVNELLELPASHAIVYVTLLGEAESADG